MDSFPLHKPLLIAQSVSHENVETDWISNRDYMTYSHIGYASNLETRFEIEHDACSISLGKLPSS
jgi:hypothetical protein